MIDVSLNVLEKLHEQLTTQQPIIPVGTTSLRTIESLYWLGVKQLLKGNIHELLQWECYDLEQQNISPSDSILALITHLKNSQQHSIIAKTQLMIAPGYQFKLAHGIITNFHQPKSTLLLLVSAMIGDDWKKVYTYALENDFRFLSYGDGCLLIKN